MFLFGKEKLEKFSSRKYKVVIFWNAMGFISLILQALLSYLGKPTVVPVEIIVGIAGGINGAYLGVNVWEKKGTEIKAAPTTSKKLNK